MTSNVQRRDVQGKGLFALYALSVACCLVLALLPLPWLVLLAGGALVLLLLARAPILGVCLAILSVPIQDLVRLPGGLSATQAAMLLALAGWGLSVLVGRRQSAGIPQNQAPQNREPVLPQPQPVLSSWFSVLRSHLLLGAQFSVLQPGATRSQPHPHLLLPWLFFLWALLLAAAFTPFSTSEAIKATMRWGVAFTTWLMTVSLVRQRWHALALVGCLLLAPAAEAAIGLAQFAGGSGPPSFHIAAGLPFVRAYGTIGQPNSFAGYLNMAWPLALALSWLLTVGSRQPSAILPTTRWPWLVALWLLTGLLLTGLLASFSRGGWLGALAGLAGLALAWGRRARLALLALIGAGVLALALGAGGLLPAAVAQRLQGIGGYLLPFDAGAVAVTPANFALVERMAQLQAGWRMLLEHPLTGVGPGNFSLAYPGVAVGQWYVPRGHAHNYYVQIAVEAGLIGWSAYLLLIASVFCAARHALRSVKEPIWHSVLLGCCGIIAAVLGHNLFENLHVLNFGIQLAAVWGLIDCAARGKVLS